MVNPFKTRLRQWGNVLLIASGVTGIILGLRFNGALQSLELSALDGLLQLQPRPPQDSRIVIVGITEADLRQQKQWPLSDATLAKLLTVIKQEQPRVIGLDLYRDLSVPPGAEALKQVFKSTPNLVGIQKVVGVTSGVAVNPPTTLKELGQVAMNDLIIDADGKSRRSLLSLEKDGQVILSLGTELALRYLSVEGIELEAVDPEQQRFQLGKTVLEPLKPNDGGYVEADTGGYQILMLSDLRYLGQGFQTISLSEVLAGKIPAGLMRDRIVIIGVTAASASDLFFVPRRNGWSNRSFLNASGVEIHADIANQLLDAALNQRLQIRAWSEPWEMFWIGLWCCLGASIPWMERHPRTRFWSSPQKPKRIGISLAALSLTSLGFGLATGSYFALQGGWWIPVMPALLGMTSSAIAVTVYLAHNASTMRQMFGRYLTDEVVANLLENPNRLKLGGEKRQVTLLVSDLRSFSAIAERLSPEASVVVINTYLEAMTEVINTYQGTINDFVGDGIFTIFGAPIQQADDTERAVACAIAMQRAMQSINQSINQNHQYQLTPLEMGIGLHTGEVLAGNIGSAKRAKYTVIGSEVNLAFRIESYTVGGQILASDRVINHCKAPVQTQRKLEVQLKGFHEAIVLYEVTGIGDRYNQFLPQQVEAMVSLQAEVPVRYQVLQDKRLLETNFEGQLLKLSNTQAELFTLCPINQLDNLKLNLLIDGTFTSDDLYAKVVEQVAEHHFWIRFTSIPPAIATQLKTLQQDNQTNLV